MTIIDPGRIAGTPTSAEDETVSKVVYTSDAGSNTTIEGRPGDSVMETAVRNGVPGIVGECGGSLSCATCHVFVAEETLGLVGKAVDLDDDLEDEMLDGTAVDREDNSRLSCQIKLQAGCEYHVTTPSTQV
jgi:2Fe-2S ferredoxin